MSDFGTPTPPPPPHFPVPPPPVPDRTGPPWELSGMSLQSFIDTAKGALMDPTTTFAQMRREGGVVPPLIYFLIGLAIGVIGMSIWRIFGLGMGMGMGGYGGEYGAAAGMGVVATLIFIPICGVIGIFLGTFIIHFALGLFGGQKFPFETTFRVMAYSMGSSYPLMIIPFCGGAIGGIWGLIVAIVGVSQAQETTIGKAAAAVLTPSVICCALFVMFWAAIAALIFGAAASGGFQ